MFWGKKLVIYWNKAVFIWWQGIKNNRKNQFKWLFALFTVDQFCWLEYVLSEENGLIVQCFVRGFAYRGEIWLIKPIKDISALGSSSYWTSLIWFLLLLIVEINRYIQPSYIIPHKRLLLCGS